MKRRLETASKGSSEIRRSKRIAERRSVVQLEVAEGPPNSRIPQSETQIEFGDPKFITEFESNIKFSTKDVVVELDGIDLTMDYFNHRGFVYPICIKNGYPVGMEMVPSTTTFDEILQLAGGTTPLRVNNVKTQKEESITMKKFIEYMKNPERTKILNLVSFECSTTNLGKAIEPPAVAVSMDCLMTCWDNQKEKRIRKPMVQKFCLIGPKYAFTNFHIDFGGTSVWYHVVRGKKTFYLINPTRRNLELYRQYMKNGGSLKIEDDTMVFKVNVNPGTTLLLPSGWIHAVYTPKDSLVFGGNFVHKYSIGLQLAVYKIEEETNTTKNYLYPEFERLHWYMARFLVNYLNKKTLRDRQVPNFIISGISALVGALEIWNIRPKSREARPFTASEGEELITSLKNGLSFQRKKFPSTQNMINSSVQTCSSPRQNVICSIKQEASV